MDPEIRQLLEKIYVSTEKTRKYFLWTLLVTVVAIVLPLIGIMLVLPSFFNNLTGASLGL